ncbi:MAG: hypothetical protein QXG00_05155 [Candidatus Woesearchaeota archaeon]
MEEICPFWRKTCFAGCNGRNHENCSMKETHAGVARGQGITDNKLLNLNIEGFTFKK